MVRTEKLFYNYSYAAEAAFDSLFNSQFDDEQDDHEPDDYDEAMERRSIEQNN